jgi:hypothetical protein
MAFTPTIAMLILVTVWQQGHQASLSRGIVAIWVISLGPAALMMVILKRLTNFL